MLGFGFAFGFSFVFYYLHKISPKKAISLSLKKLEDKFVNRAEPYVTNI
jgi:hypothetical protein